jgi:hypothetical protein
LADTSERIATEGSGRRLETDESHSSRTALDDVPVVTPEASRCSDRGDSTPIVVDESAVDIVSFDFSRTRLAELDAFSA